MIVASDLNPPLDCMAVLLSQSLCVSSCVAFCRKHVVVRSIDHFTQELAVQSQFYPSDYALTLTMKVSLQYHDQCEKLSR